MNIIQVGIPLEPDTLVVLSAELREYVGLSHEGGYLHHVRPLRLEEPIVGEGRRSAGALTCDCRGGQVRGSCYWVTRAESFEASRPHARPSWAPRAALEAGVATFDAPAPTPEEVPA
jgi:hypothetical protein